MRLLPIALALAAAPYTTAQTWQPVGGGASSTVYALEPFNGDLYAGGLFTSIGGGAAQYLGRWDGSAWHPVANLITYMAADGLYANDTALFIVDGGRVRFWNGTNLYNLTGQSSSSFNSSVYAITHFQDTLYCGGFFSSPLPHVAKWNGSSYQPLTTGCNAQVDVLTPFQDHLFVAGNFQLAGDSLVNRTALWDGAAWHAMGAGVNDDVFVHCFFRDTLYIGGRFTQANGQSASRVAKWNGSQWERVGGTLNDYVTAMAVYRGQLYIGGAFTAPGHIARLLGNTWVPVGSGCNDRVRTMEVYHDTLFVGGDFTTAGGQPALRIAKWHLPEAPVAQIAVDDTVVCVNACVTFSDLSPNGVSARLWHFPGGMPATSTDSLVTVCYNTPGAWPAMLTVTNAGGSDSTSLADAVLVEVCSQTSEQTPSSGIRIGPNPALGSCLVHADAASAGPAQLLNAAGQAVATFSLVPGSNTLQLTAMPAGIYQLRTSSGHLHRLVVLE